MDEMPIPQKSPFVMDMKPGTYAWCACGKSGKQPFCDGSHKGTPHRPVIEKIESSKKVAWCGCKRTNGTPYCDGSHAGL